MSMGRLALLLVAALIAFFLVVPTLIVIPMSFNSTPILQFPPSGFSLRWYESFFAARQWTASAGSSLIVATLAALISTILGTLAAYALVRGTMPGKRLILGLLISPLAVPVVIVAIGMYSVYVQWKLTGSLAGLVLAHTALAVPFVVITVSTSLRTTDRNLEIAARGLGASRWQTFRRITLPLALPGIAAGALFAFITSWDEVVVALFISSARVRTLPVQMWSQLSERVDPTVAAVSTMLLLVTISLSAAALIVRRSQPQ